MRFDQLIEVDPVFAHRDPSFRSEAELARGVQPSDVTNPRYLAYCRAHGLGPAEMRRRDEGFTSSFASWISRAVGQYNAERGRHRAAPLTDQAAFSEWLEGYARTQMLGGGSRA